MSSRLFVDAIYLHAAGEGKTIPADQGGFIFTHEQIEEIIAKIERWYEATSPDTIADHNEETREKYFPSTPRSSRPEPKPRRVLPGFIYVIKSGQYTKIGRTQDLKTRIGSIGAKLPIEPVVIATYPVDDSAAAEATLHSLFAKKRLNGEWFDLDDTDIEQIRHLFED